MNTRNRSRKIKSETLTETSSNQKPPAELGTKKSKTLTKEVRPRGGLAKKRARPEKKPLGERQGKKIKRIISDEECEWIVNELGKLHPHIVDRNDKRRQEWLEGCGGNHDSLLDSVISTMLSQNTTDANSKAGFRKLKERFPTWSQVLQEVKCASSLEAVEDCIRVAGLANTRAKRIHKLLDTLVEERGEPPSLEYLRDYSNKDDIKQELSRFPGLGPKTISCVLLFGMGKSEFPVDTHVLRIAHHPLQWLNSNSSREAAYEELNAVIPAQYKLDLHCLLVTHGKHCHTCAARGKPQFPPKDGSKIVCPLVRVTKRFSKPSHHDDKEKSIIHVKLEEVVSSTTLDPVMKPLVSMESSEANTKVVLPDGIVSSMQTTLSGAHPVVKTEADRSVKVE